MSPSSDGRRAESLSSVHAGEHGFPGTLLQLLRGCHPTDRSSSIHAREVRPAAAPTCAGTRCTEERVAKVCENCRGRCPATVHGDPQALGQLCTVCSGSLWALEDSPPDIPAVIAPPPLPRTSRETSRPVGEAERRAGDWGAEVTSCPVTGTIPLSSCAVPHEHLYSDRCARSLHPHLGLS